MFGAMSQHAENERLRMAYISLRAKFGKLAGVIEECSGSKQGYQGVEIAKRETVSLTLCFFDRIIVQAEFSGVIEDKRQQMIGRIVFSQNGSQCRTYFFDEFDSIFDAYGHEIEAGKMFDVKLTSHLLNEVYHKLIEDGVAFETVKLWR